MDDYCYAKMVTSCQRESERQPETSNKSPREIKTKDEDVEQPIGHPEEGTWTQETPQPPCIKKEEEELCITQEGECLLGREEADYTKFPLTVVSVKTEDDEEKPQVDNLLAPLSDSVAEDEVEEPLSSDADCEDDMRTHTHIKHSEPSKKKRGKTDVQQLIGHPEVLPPQSGGSSTLKQETPQPPCIKKEEEELWITHEGECLLEREEADYTKFPLTVVSVKTEDDEEKPQVDNLLAPLSDSDTEDDDEEPLSSDKDCEGDMRTHTDNKHSECPTKKKGKTGLSCSVCAESFTKSSLLTQHMRTHTRKRPFNCSVCGKVYVSRQCLTRHTRTHTGLKPYDCLVCGKSFTRNTYMTQHMRTHTGEKPFNCSICGKRFSRNSYLTSHMRTHTGEKPFNCSVCGKKFSLNNRLTEHMRTHTGEKTFSCSVCGKIFVSRQGLNRHLMTHSGLKPFNCSVCGKGFSRNSYLTQHMRLHTGEKTFNCLTCAKGFTFKSNLTEHMKKHSKERTFSCSVCGKRFHRNADAVKHIRTHKRK
ncbi:zinc finger protein 771-like isoform X1 [Nerophis ophidion]|uniref:zinc finger protein 771-like isoform X1 n=1 Tax=Nerophis ophidion TaxID=159077 RepID=UPI002ADF2B73|nr:zinc finger protein 771-like isoform X1 [Nerophis ophidion]